VRTTACLFFVVSCTTLVAAPTLSEFDAISNGAQWNEQGDEFIQANAKVSSAVLLVERKSPPASRATTSPVGWIDNDNGNRLMALHPTGTVKIEF
jgi:hypothetical protein